MSASGEQTMERPRATTPAPSGPVLWFATFGGIVTWMVHLIAEASLVPLHEEHRDVVWVMHGLTVVLALGVLVGMRISWSYARLGMDEEADPTPAGRTAFLGLLGLVIGALSLVLVVYEGVLVSVIRRGRP
jgi:hypothetical protein